MGKSADAFRTISEVADWLEVPAHVLRFWESKFTQVKPVKRAGGRRYYRPADMRLLGGIKVLLHDEGFTIKGVQKVLRDEGVSHVAALSPAFGEEDAAPVPPPVAQVLSFARPDAAEQAGADTAGTPAADDTQAAPAPAPDTEARTGAGTQAETETDAKAGMQAETETDAEAGMQAGAETGAEAGTVPESGRAPAPSPVPAPGASPADAPQAAAPPPLPGLPDIPGDPPDDMAAAPGPLTRLAALPRPLPEGLGPALAALAARLREAGASKA